MPPPHPDLLLAGRVLLVVTAVLLACGVGRWWSAMVGALVVAGVVGHPARRPVEVSR